MSEIKIVAKVQKRKEIERLLDRARKEYSSAQESYNTCKTRLEDLEKNYIKAKDEMQAARDQIIDLTRHIQLMDITGAESIKDRGEEKTYFIGQKEYHLDSSDVNDVKIIPWKEYKKDDIVLAFKETFSSIKKVSG